jgi:hypothetical protein
MKSFDINKELEPLYEVITMSIQPMNHTQSVIYFTAILKALGHISMQIEELHNEQIAT